MVAAEAPSGDEKRKTLSTREHEKERGKKVPPARFDFRLLSGWSPLIALYSAFEAQYFAKKVYEIKSEPFARTQMKIMHMFRKYVTRDTCNHISTLPHSKLGGEIVNSASVKSAAIAFLE